MKSILRKIFFLMLLVSWGPQLFGQWYPEKRIENKASIRYEHLDGYSRSLESNLVSFPVKDLRRLYIYQSAPRSFLSPGDSVVLTILVRNIGATALSNVWAADTLPRYLTLLSVNQGQVQGSVVRRTWSTLVPDQQDSLVIIARVEPTVPEGSVLVNTAYASDSTGTVVTSPASLPIVSAPRFFITKSASPKPVKAGDTLTYTLHVSNDGSGVGTGVRIEDAVPPGALFISASNGGRMTNGIVSWSVGFFSNFSSREIQMKVAIPSDMLHGSKILNTAQLTADGGISIASNQDTTEVYNIKPKLHIAKTASADTIVLGDTVRYVLRLQNTGNMNLTNVEVRDTISTSLTILAVSPNAQRSGNVISSTFKTLNVGGADSVWVTAQLQTDLPHWTTIVNTASAASDQITTRQYATREIVTSARPNILFTKTATADTVVAGTTVRYVLRIENTGHTILTNVNIRDTLSTSLTIISLSGNAQRSGNGNVVLSTLKTLPIGAVDSVWIFAQVRPDLPDGMTIVNTASAASDQMPARRYATRSIVTSALPNVLLTKTASADTIVVGDTVRYVVRVRNNGNMALTNLDVRDTIPSSLAIVSFSGNAQRNDNVISSTWKTLSAGAVDSVWIVAHVRSDLPNRLTIVNTASAASDQIPARRYATRSIVTSALPKMLLSKTASADTIVVGDTVRYVVHVRNNGNMALTNLDVRDTIPSSLTIVSFSENAQRNGNVVSSTLKTLPVGAADSLWIIAHVRSDLPNRLTIVNTASAASDQTTARQYAACEIVTSALPNMLLSKTASADTVVVGNTVRYVLHVMNNGLTTLTNVEVRDTIASSLAILSISENARRDGNVISSMWKTLPVGAMDSVWIIAQVRPDLPNGLTVVNTASAASDELVARHYAARSIVTSSLPGMLLTKSASADTIVVGDTVRYVLRVRNTGNVKLTNVEITDTLSTTLTILSVSPNAQRNGNVVSLRLNTLSVGAVDSLWIIAQVRSDLPNRLTIVNTASALSDQLTDRQYAACDVVTSSLPGVLLTKTASADTVAVGDTVRYVLRVWNTGNVMLTNLDIRDTIPSSLTVVSVSGNAQRSDNVISSTLKTLPVGAVDSVWIIARLRSDLPNRLTVVNTGSAASDQTPRTFVSRGIVSRVLVGDKSCMIALRSVPSLIIGNGIEASVIEAFVSDTLGRPKPDGTPVTFSTTNGFFSNGRNSIVVSTLNGRAIDSVRALIVSSTIDTSYVTVSADDADVCSASSRIMVVFYPGAITGVVHNRQNRQPVENVLVLVYSSANELVASARTGPDGRYLIPVPRTDTYRVVIQTKNAFGEVSTATMQVPIVVPPTGGHAPTSGNNQIQGSIYYLVSHRPIPAAGISVLLNPITGGVLSGKTSPGTAALMSAIDSTVTDSAGAYLFANIKPGTYEVAISHRWIQGKDTVENIGGGELVVDVNIPVVLNPNLTFTKQGPSHVTAGDSALYTITASNAGTYKMTNTVIVDTLDRSMKVAGVSSPGIYESAAHRIIWNIGTLSSGSQISHSVQVVFVDTLREAFTATNRATITSDETLPTQARAETRVYVPSKLQIWKTSSVSSAQPGDTVSYTIVVENAAGARADSIRVSDALPSQVRFLGTTPMAHYDTSAHQLRWFVDSLRMGQRWQAIVKTIVRSDLPPGEFTYTNSADLVWRDGTSTSLVDPRSQAQVRTLVSYLQVSKQAVRKVVDIGDFASYVVRVTNLSTVSTARNVTLTDRIPFGFSYMAGSSVLDSTRAKDPAGRHELRWTLTDSLPPSATLTLSYRLVVGAGGVEGTGVNTAQAFALSHTGSPLVSAPVSERVEVRRGVFTDRGIIVGKVFYDDNRNLAQDEGEEGVKNVELMMEDGTRIVTGDDGKYSLPDVAPGRHVIKVRQHTLPEGAELLEGDGAFAGDPSSRFVVLTESNIARADFYLARSLMPRDTVHAWLEVAPVGRIRFHRRVEPRTIVFVEDERKAALRLTGAQFDAGKATLRQSALGALRELGAIVREVPDQHLWIVGHTDSIQIRTKEFPTNQALSLARAEAVKNYLVVNERISAQRMSTVGSGATRPIASNRDAAGRAKNRRVEVTFGDNTVQPQRSPSSVEFRIPISYSGPVPIQRIVVHDVLDTLFHYTEGSATLGDQPIIPRIEGNNLFWTLESIGKKFNKVLTYRATVSCPQRGIGTGNSQSTLSFITEDTVVAVDREAHTSNEIIMAGHDNAVNHVVSGLFFEKEKATLRPFAIRILRDIGELLRNDPGAIAMIDGHTDSQPVRTREFSSNVEFSRARAQSVADYLASSHGIQRSRLHVAGWGASRPIASNATADGRQANHRVEIKIYRKAFSDQLQQKELRDSSKTTEYTFIPDVKEIGDRLAIVEPGTVLQLSLKAAQHLDAESRIVFTDSLNPAFTLEPESIMPVRGIDAVVHQESSLQCEAASADSVSEVRYFVVVSPDINEPMEIGHSVLVEIRHADGTTTRTRSTPVTIRIQRR